MDSLEIFKNDTGAHTNAEILGIVEIPGGGVTHNFPAICRLLQHGQIPESLRHGQQPHRSVEHVTGAEHPLHRVVLADHLRSGIGRRFVRIRLNGRVQIDPETSPHVAKQMGRQSASQVDLIGSVSVVELTSDVSVQLFVQRLHLAVQILDY